VYAGRGGSGEDDPTPASPLASLPHSLLSFPSRGPGGRLSAVVLPSCLLTADRHRARNARQGQPGRAALGTRLIQRVFARGPSVSPSAACRRASHAQHAAAVRPAARCLPGRPHARIVRGTCLGLVGSGPSGPWCDSMTRGRRSGRSDWLAVTSRRATWRSSFTSPPPTDPGREG
jgi:hypothetical protein